MKVEGSALVSWYCERVSVQHCWKKLTLTETKRTVICSGSESPVRKQKFRLTCIRFPCSRGLALLYSAAEELGIVRGRVVGLAMEPVPISTQVPQPARK